MDVRAQAKAISLDSLPEKSKRKYVATYNIFKQWCKNTLTADTDFYCEDVLLVYMNNLSENYAPPTLYTIFSQLKATINSIHFIDCGKYSRVTHFLRKQNVGYESKVSAVFTKENIVEFLNNAPDEFYLYEKVSYNYYF